MKLKTFVISAAVALSAVAANAAVVQNSYSTELTNMHATHLNGTNYSAKDTACKDQFGQMMGKKVSGEYRLDTAQNVGEGSVTFDGVRMGLTPIEMNGVYGFATTAVPASLTDQYIEHIHVKPGTNSNNTEALVRMKAPVGDYVCVASTDGYLPM